ncbi:leucine-rich repeat-containing protein 20 isoform X2 [Pelobates fuscus]|uniref:leucine-rich repeat-containing protein 20 isoform X2 n=1 Tax=Pelobates fuscus TaxID=191477 RepID=UPI002FE4580A
MSGNWDFYQWKRLSLEEQELRIKAKKMAEAVARVARKVNEVVEKKEKHLDLSKCALTSFPVGLYVVMADVTQDIQSITLANNEIKTMTSKFFSIFTQLVELNLEGNVLKNLPDNISSLTSLTSINLSKNKFQDFPIKLLDVSTIECINLEDNEIKDVPVEKLCSMSCLKTVNLKGNPVNKDLLDNSEFKFELII